MRFIQTHISYLQNALLTLLNGLITQVTLLHLKKLSHYYFIASAAHPHLHLFISMPSIYSRHFLLIGHVRHLCTLFPLRPHVTVVTNARQCFTQRPCVAYIPDTFYSMATSRIGHKHSQSTWSHYHYGQIDF